MILSFSQIFRKRIIYRNTKMSRISKQTLHLKSSNLFKCKNILMLMFVIKFIVFIKGITNDHVGSGQTEGDKIKATKNWEMHHFHAESRLSENCNYSTRQKQMYFSHYASKINAD